MEKLAQMEHERRVEERTRAGWVLGPRDLLRKRSPHPVSRTELDEETCELDRLFVRIHPGFLLRAGSQIVRGNGRGEHEEGR